MLNEAGLINENKRFEAAFDSDAESEHLVEEMIGSEPNVTTLIERDDFQDELYDRRERHEARMAKEARAAYDNFRGGFEWLRSRLRDAFIGLGVNPAIRKAPKKYS